ncbi:MAG TPA: C45 family autoproteolytic acyltransferase/hydrolase [Smithellaceae bacterium]|mgnify:CR=1 FL=1|nr:C45 family autoproteolytic acyltransferase/hydrolase [Smithellaceae bacterium]HRS90072.1 C45 family autoproteolytic acyltransferase/hydrolase [Smithellaceae bacterium]HRV26922.1 C45 family autoproteolytic acyltransferase/hydrolase [Smithellaceae bacterium]
MKKRYLLLLSGLFVLLIACGGGGGGGSTPVNGTVEFHSVGNENMGYYEVILNYNDDNDYRMGQLYGQELNLKSPALEGKFADYFLSFDVEKYNNMMQRIQSIKNQIPQEYRDFINGLASQFNGGTINDKGDGKLSVDEIFYFSLSSSIDRGSQCSVIAVYGSASDTGRPIIGRLLDWGSMSHNTIFYINKGNKRIVNIGNTLLNIATMTGLNQHGIFVAILDSPTGELFPASLDTYYAYTFDLRYALENYSTIEDVAHYLIQHPYTFNHLILIGDNNTVKIIENNLTRTRALRDSSSELNDGITWEYSNAVAAVNAFLLKNNYDNFTYSSFNTYRWQSIKNQLELYFSSDNKITVDEMRNITTYYGTNIFQYDDGVIMNSITQQIIIYDSMTSSLKVFFRNNRAMGSENNTTTFNIDDPNFLDISVQF